MAKEINVRDYRYLIIGGTSRAATTSMFFYLSDHPQVCSANIKETRFFLDPDYPFRRKHRFEEGLEKYDEFFSHCLPHCKLRVDATPDYLYSRNAPSRIRSSLPFVKILFILRDPVSRMISWYRYAKQMGQLPQTMTFEAYVQEQIDAVGKRVNRFPYMKALEQGRYSVYLRPYFEHFNPEDLCIVWFEDVCKKPKQTIQKICSFAGIDPAFYEDYNFKVFNQAHPIRNTTIHYIYWNLSDRLRYHVNNRTLIRKILKSLRLAIEPWYLKLNARPKEELIIMPQNKLFLIDYYRDEAKRLENLIGESPPWKL